jgi:hypothetical protein
VIERTDFDDAGVVDQNVNPAEVIDDLPDSSANLIAIEQVAFDGENFSATCGEIGFRAGEFFRIACEEGNLSALAANMSRQDETKSPRSATDQDNLIVQRELCCAKDTSGYPTAHKKSRCSEPNASIHCTIL